MASFHLLMWGRPSGMLEFPIIALFCWLCLTVKHTFENSTSTCASTLLCQDFYSVVSCPVSLNTLIKGAIEKTVKWDSFLGPDILTSFFLLHSLLRLAGCSTCCVSRPNVAYLTVSFEQEEKERSDIKKKRKGKRARSCQIVAHLPCQSR